MSEQPVHVVVVGGGVIGTACAYFLSRAGCRVTVVERAEFGMGCSHGNCGLICPSHVLPLAVPGAVGDAWTALFSADSPLYIKPRLSPSLWGWLYRFWRRCNEHDMMESARGIHALVGSSRSLYDELIRTESLDAEWETRGALFVFRTAAAMEHFAQTDRLVRDTFGVGATRYEGEAARELEPALKPGLAGAWHQPLDAHVRPDKLLASWRRVLERRGVQVREQCEFLGFCRRAGRADAIDTTQGRVEADAFVFTTGAWTPRLARQLGCRIPIQPGKGYSITMPRPATCPTIPLFFEEHRVVVTPFASGYRLGSTMEFAGYDTTLNRGRLELLRTGASHYLFEPHCEPVLEEWYGWRPMTFDSRPIIDRSPALSNVFIAAGHNMLGMTAAPATGKLIAALVCHTPPPIDPAPYRVGRFC